MPTPEIMHQLIQRFEDNLLLGEGVQYILKSGIVIAFHVHGATVSSSSLGWQVRRLGLCITEYPQVS